MPDVHSREQRSRNMAAIRGKNTKPELKVRSALHALGYRFRLHQKKLPGNPDIVLAKHRTVIFVHGCFWHCHDCSYGKVTPATRADFWSRKRAGTVERDERNAAAIRALGWNVVTLWECQTRNADALTSALDILPNQQQPASPHSAKREHSASGRRRGIHLPPRNSAIL